jgi:hypothetical protein
VEVVDKLNRGMNTTAARYQNGVNEWTFFLSRKPLMASAPLCANISLVSHCAHSLKMWKGPCVS